MIAALLLAGCARRELSPLPAPVRAETSAELVSFRVYWEPFREAAILNDPHRLADLARFPFRATRLRDAEEIRVEEIDRPAFIAKVPHWLSLAPDPEWITPEPQPRTMHALIDSHREVTDADLASKFDGRPTAIIGRFTFTRFPDGWRFTAVSED